MSTEHVAVDAFDLPDWLGTSEVTWTTDDPLDHRPRLRGTLSTQEHRLPCDLIMVDQPFPSPVLGEEARRAAHEHWRREEALLVEVDGRLCVAVPGTRATPDLVLAAVARLARAVGAPPEHYLAALRATAR